MARAIPSKNVFLFYYGFVFIWNYPVCLSAVKLAPAEYPVNDFSSKLKYEKLAVVVHILQTTRIEDITWWPEDMNFMFEWQEQYLTSERSERVRYYSCHENIKFISSSQRVMFFLLY